MQRVKLYDDRSSKYKTVTVPTGWRIVKYGGHTQVGDKVYRWRDNFWMDVWKPVKRSVNQFHLVIRPVPTKIGWDISNIVKKGARQ